MVNSLWNFLLIMSVIILGIFAIDLLRFKRKSKKLKKNFNFLEAAEIDRKGKKRKVLWIKLLVALYSLVLVLLLVT